MKQAVPHRQMELNPRITDGDMHSPEQILHQVEQASQQAEFYENQMLRLEAKRRALEESNERKALFDESLNEIGMKLRNAVRRLEKELDSMNREQQEVTQITECLKRHYQILISLQPENWSSESFDDRLREAMPKLDRAINDFEEAYAGPSRYRHTEIFRHKPGIDKRLGINWDAIRDQLIRGFYFHLPLFLLLLLTWGVYMLITHT